MTSHMPGEGSTDPRWVAESEIADGSKENGES